jgi:hypothetical protein
MNKGEVPPCFTVSLNVVVLRDHHIIPYPYQVTQGQGVGALPWFLLLCGSWDTEDR